MCTLQRFSVVVFALGISSTLMTLPIFAQIIDIRDYRGKQITCVTSGLRGFDRSCGATDSYETVFIGSIVSVTEISDVERRLQLMPEEVFTGKAEGLLTVTTNQGACMSEFQTGDKWLFYLQRDTKAQKLLLSYGSPSGPIGESQAQIALLRRLANTNDSGVVMGRVMQNIWNDNKWEKSIPIANFKIQATQQANGREYVAFTDSDGNYEFEPLAPGSYHLTPNTADGLWAEEGNTVVILHSCSEVSFGLEPDGRIAGRLTAVDGKPAKYVQVAIVPQSAGNLQFTSALTDELGRFEVKALHPGRYLVGVGIQAHPKSAEWRSRVYYPGVRDRNLAVIIDLDRAEKRMNVDFQLPQ